MPPTERSVMMRSHRVPRFTAEMTPMATPTTEANRSAASASLQGVGKLLDEVICDLSVRIDRACRVRAGTAASDSPDTGREAAGPAPVRCRILAMVSGLERSPTMARTGSPGSDCIRTKVIRVMPSSVGTNRRTRLRIYNSMMGGILHNPGKNRNIEKG